MTIMYSARYDAHYDSITGQWTEPACDDPDCEFCAGRPETAPTTKENDNA